MKDQIIITMGREHGSGGHYIADMIARELGIKLYDKDSIESEIVSEGYSEELIRRMDEKPVNFFASRRIGRFSNSLEVNVAEKTFDMIRAKAASGESFLLIGRCGEQVLKDDPHRVSLFIGGDPHAKLCRVMEKKGLSAEEAIEEIRTVDHQLTVSGCDDRRELPFHKMLLAGELPLTMGGGIGQSRLCMLMIGTAHIGEVQVSLWDDDTLKTCADAGILLL